MPLVSIEAADALEKEDGAFLFVHFDRRRHIYQVYPKMSAPSTGLQ